MHSLVFNSLLNQLAPGPFIRFSNTSIFFTLVFNHCIYLIKEREESSGMPSLCWKFEQLKVAGEKIIELVDCHVKCMHKSSQQSCYISLVRFLFSKGTISCLLFSQTPFLPFLLHWKKRCIRESSHHPSPALSPSNLQATLIPPVTTEDSVLNVFL